MIKFVKASVLSLVVSGMPFLAAAQHKSLTPDHIQIVNTVNTIFIAARKDDVAKFDSVIAPGFYIFDGGAQFNGDSIMGFIKAQQHRQLTRSQVNRTHAGRNARKLEHGRLQALVPQHITIAVPRQDLQAVAATRSEEEQMTDREDLRQSPYARAAPVDRSRTACWSPPQPARSAAPARHPAPADSADRSRLHLPNRQQPTQMTRIKSRIYDQAPAAAMRISIPTICTGTGAEDAGAAGTVTSTATNDSASVLRKRFFHS
jgi:hypothetical protein